MSALLFLFLATLAPLQEAATLPSENLSVEQKVTTQDFAPVQIVMEFETEKKGKRVDNESGNYTVAFSDSRYAMITGTADQQIQLIVDVDGRTMTTVTTDKKGETAAIKMPLIRMGKGLFEDLNQNVEQTEEVRKILGYDCRKYIVSNDGDVTESWIANVPGLAWGELAQALIGGKKSSTSNLMAPIKDMPNAFALESHTTLKGGKKVVHSYVRTLNLGTDADLSALEIPANAEVQDLTGLMKF
ncbi:MAG: DUF4412 domain-containing protein [Saprospiraceae bacterium]